MLQSLHIKNYALIENLNIDFNKGFSIITGETGAGKSILLGALSMVLGNRADTSVLRDKTKKCVVEAIFDVSALNLESLFDDLDLDYHKDCMLRREINSSGKSRAFVNDTPVNLTTIKSICSRLIDIHSQFENLSLKYSLFQLSILDGYCNNSELLKKYKKAYNRYVSARTLHQELVNRAEKEKSDEEYFRFQLEKFEQVDLAELDQQELESELEMMNHAEEIKKTLLALSQFVTEEENGFIGFAKTHSNDLSKISKIFPEASDLYDRMEKVIIELDDIAYEADKHNNSIEFDERRVDYLNETLNIIYELQHKHNAKTVSELVEVKEEFESRLSAIDSYDFEIEESAKRLDKYYNDALILANKLSDIRNSKTTEIRDNIVGNLVSLGIKNAEFRVDIRKMEQLTPEGYDRAEFLFSANKNSDLKEIYKVASGGEMSRLMLCLKNLMNNTKSYPTIIFDEIDTGISGEVAEKMGNLLVGMSKNMQLINITHLPQIAAKGNYHYRVYKFDEEESTKSNIEMLTNEERIVEIAKMLSGENITAASRSNAKELLQL